MTAAQNRGGCHHRHLELLPQESKRLRCRYCHLTITAKELSDGFCPECYDVHGKKRYDFEEVAALKEGKVRYRCETCGAIIEGG